MTGTDLVKLYADKIPGRQFGVEETRALARALVWEISFIQVDDLYLSPSESFAVLLRWYLRNPGEASVRPLPGLLGPLRRETAEPPARAGKWEFRKACEDALGVMLRAGHVPSVVWIGSRPVDPADFLATLASETLEESPGNWLEMRKGRLTVESYAAKDSPDLFDWVIMPEGLRAPHVMDLARLQCWSLKPAVPDNAALSGTVTKKPGRR